MEQLYKKTVRALVVDPDKHYRSILRSVLRNYGCGHIEDAGSVQQAFELIPCFEPDIIFVEYSLPDLSGLEFVRLVRSAGFLPRYDYPIVLMTSFARKSMVIKAAKSGADAFVLKPIQPSIIYERLQPLLSGRRSVFDRWDQISNSELPERLEI